jgi:cytochrome c biogenesis protein CcmG/thiol:disulfide interchange protein DsbE
MIRLLAIPLLLFGVLLLLLLAGLKTADERQTIRSPLIGKPVPSFELPTLDDPQRTVTNAELAGEPYLLNVWGSWCPACRVEHPFVKRLAEEAPVPMIGLNWKDERDDALRWIRQFGNGWDLQIVDFEGVLAIDLGVYGAPETFLVDHNGVIRHKHIGPIDPVSFDDLMERARGLDAIAEQAGSRASGAAAGGSR